MSLYSFILAHARQQRETLVNKGFKDLQFPQFGSDLSTAVFLLHLF